MRLALLLLLGTAGCGTINNLGDGPHVYGGVRSVGRYHDLGINYFSYCDLPFSFVLDTGLLPVTALFELTRATTGWPPPSERLYPDPDWLVKSQIKAAKKDLSNLDTAVEFFRAYNGAYPTSEEGLKRVFQKFEGADPQFQGRYLVGQGPRRDPWGNAYVYRSPGLKRSYDLFSSGPDGKPDTADDVSPDP